MGQMRKGNTSDDPYIDISESFQVINNKVVLSELPEQFNRVKATLEGVEFYEKQSGTPNNNEYVVDYNLGIVTFNPIHNGKTFQFDYKGTGYYLFNGARIFLLQGNVTKTLEDIIESGQEGIDALENLNIKLTEINEAISNSETATLNANNATVNATTKINELQKKIDSADDQITNKISEIDVEATTAINEKMSDLDGIFNTQLTTWNTNEQERVNAENTRKLEETDRQSNENERITSEQQRLDNEELRKNSELARDTAENIRQQQETQRQTDTQTAITNTVAVTNEAIQAKDNAQNLVDTLVHLGDYSPSENYVINNEVRYNGSTWRCVQDCIGVTPVEGVNWTLVAQRGVDGEGSVSSVNGKNPNENGNVTIVANDVGAISSSEKGVAGGIALLNAEGKPIDSQGNVIEGNVKTVNNTQPDEFGNINVPTFSGSYSDLTDKPFIPSKASELSDDVGLAHDADIVNINNQIGNLSELDTTEKSNLVGSVNEIKQLVDTQRTEMEGKIELNILDFGAIGDNVTDNTSALLSALNAANGRKIKIPSGIYKINSEILYNGKVNLEGEGDSTVIDLSDGGNFLFSSAINTLPNLSNNIVAGGNDVVFSGDHGLSQGDVFIVYNPADYSWASYRDYYRDGCMFRVDEVLSSTEVRVLGVSPNNYDSISMVAYKLTGQGVSMKDLKINPNSIDSVLVWIDGHRGVRINNVTIPKGGGYTGFEIWRCFDVDIEGVTSEIFNGDSYPITISNSQKVTITRCSLYSSRHALALGGRTGDACVPTRDVLINQCHLWNRSNSGVGASDIHGNCENITYSNCYMNTGANMAGSNVKYSNCTIIGRNPKIYPDGNCVFGSEIVSGNFTLEDCRLISYGDGVNFGGGLQLNVSGRKNSVQVIVRNCTIENRSESTAFRAITIGVSSDARSSRIDVEINGLNFISNKTLFAFVSFAGLADVSTVASCIIDNVYATMGGTLFVASNINNHNMPMRMPSQSGSQSITATSGTSFTEGAIQNFKYIYPRQPHAQISVGHSSSKIYNGNRAIYAGLQQITPTNIKPFIESGDATSWTATFETNAMWTVGINEI